MYAYHDDSVVFEDLDDDYYLPNHDSVAYGSAATIDDDYTLYAKWAGILFCFWLATRLDRWWPKRTPPSQRAPPAPEVADVRNSRLAVLRSARTTSNASPPTRKIPREDTAAVGKTLPAREAMILFSRRRQDGKDSYTTFQRFRSKDVDEEPALVPDRYLFPTDYTALPTRSLKWISMLPDNIVTDLSHPTVQVIVARVYNAVGRVTGAFHRATLAETGYEIPLSLEDHIGSPMPGCQVLGRTMFNTCRPDVSRFTCLRTGFECCSITIRRGLSVERFIETLAHELAHVIVHLEAIHPSNPFGRAPFRDYTAMEEGICTAVSLLAAGYLSGKDFTRSEATDSIMKAVLKDEQEDDQPDTDTVEKGLVNVDALAGKEFVKTSYEDTFRHVMKNIDMFPTFLDLLDSYLKHGFV
ncbi:hypothetical protein BDZ88DRAFT_275596 [Geranomyces variabilis]|nr:hypothetical protein BDZ88DRAFT_275596 [Geranomyces variabilis]KAJ3138612.1 hypothetical protein HDU90_001055 [Geranomyces variabilis]